MAVLGTFETQQFVTVLLQQPTMVHHTKVQYREHGPETCHLNSVTFLLNTQKKAIIFILSLSLFFETFELLFSSFIPLLNVLCKWLS